MQDSVPLSADRSVRHNDLVSNTDKPSKVADHQGERCKPAAQEVVVTTCGTGRGEVFFQIRCSRLIMTISQKLLQMLYKTK